MTAIDPRIEAFVAEARRYCDWALAPDGWDRPAADALSRLVSLYQAALALPTATPDFDEPPEFDVRAEETRVRTACARLPLQYYSEQFDPLVVPPTEEPTVGDLANDISEVFADARKGLLLFDRGYVAAAIWEWTWRFQNHWGRHAACAIRVLHAHFSENGWE